MINLWASGISGNAVLPLPSASLYRHGLPLIGRREAKVKGTMLAPECMPLSWVKGSAHVLSPWGPDQRLALVGSPLACSSPFLIGLGVYKRN